MTPHRKVALVHDWLNGMRGGERVLEYFCRLFPDADLFTLLYEPENVSETIRSLNVCESPFARLPRARRNYRNLLPLMPLFIDRLPTADYSLVISTSHCVAKAAPPPARGRSLSYVFSPMRYVWDHYEDYLSGVWWKDKALALAREPLQQWDRRTANRVDSFAADSGHIAEKVKKFWGRCAETIYPPVNLSLFEAATKPPDDYFLVLSALTPYKKVDRAIEAARIAKVPLAVVGDGPERQRLQASAPPNVTFAGRVKDDELQEWYRGARALIYPGVEDFGITAIEAQACGRPVIALRKGGVTETVIEGVTGAFFDEPTAKSLASVLRRHEDDAYDSAKIRMHAESFSPQRFESKLSEWIDCETRFLA